MLRFMNSAKRLGLAVLLIAISVGLVNLPATASSTAATISSSTAERAVVDYFACQDATRDLPLAKKAVTKAKKVLAKKKRALKRAKRHHASKATIKKARKAVKKAKRSLRKKRARVERLRASKERNCATQTIPTEPPAPPSPSSLSADQLGQLLALLSGAANGGSSLPLDQAQITALLDGIIPGGAGALDPAVLTDLLSGFTGFGPSALDAHALTAMLGAFGDFSPEQLTSLLGASPDPAVFAALLQVFMDQFGDLAGGGFEMPGTLNPTQLTDLFTGVLDDLLGGLIPGVPGLPGLPDLPCVLFICL